VNEQHVKLRFSNKKNLKSALSATSFKRNQIPLISLLINVIKNQIQLGEDPKNFSNKQTTIFEVNTT